MIRDDLNTALFILRKYEPFIVAWKYILFSRHTTILSILKNSSSCEIDLICIINARRN